jgi:hypothetical protein
MLLLLRLCSRNGTRRMYARSEISEGEAGIRHSHALVYRWGQAYLWRRRADTRRTADTSTSSASRRLLRIRADGPAGDAHQHCSLHSTIANMHATLYCQPDLIPKCQSLHQTPGQSFPCAYPSVYQETLISHNLSGLSAYGLFFLNLGPSL